VKEILLLIKLRFTHPKYLVGVYDTTGFENEVTVIKVKKLLEEQNITLCDERKKNKFSFIFSSIYR
jgi:hypothetical protein